MLALTSSMFCPHMLYIESLASLPIISSYNRISIPILSPLSRHLFFSFNIINVTNYSIYFICSFFLIWFLALFSRGFLFAASYRSFFLFYIPLFFLFLTTTLYYFLILADCFRAIFQCWRRIISTLLLGP